MTDTPNPTADLVAALAALADPVKTGKVDAGQRHYAFMTLPDLLTACRSVLGAHHIAVMQHVTKTDVGVAVTTTLLHASGHTWVTEPLELPSQRDPQSVGSAITYGRRYQLAALVGLTGSDDDDAQAAQPSRRPAPPTTVRVKPAPTPEPAEPEEEPIPAPPGLITPAQMRKLGALIGDLERQSGEKLDRDRRRHLIRDLAGLDTLESAKDLTIGQASAAIDALTAITTGDQPQPEQE